MSGKYQFADSKIALDQGSKLMNGLVGQQLGSYKLVEKLGVGGFADVYLGEHIYIKNKKDAIKVLKGRFSKQDIEKFREEAQLIHNLKHPHIVRVIDFNV